MPPGKYIPKKRNRRRLGARNYKNYSEEMLLLAVDLVKNKNTSSYEAEKQFGIPRRTIEKRVKNLHSDKPGPRFRLNQEEENKIIKVLIAAGDFGCPLSRLDLKLAVYDYLKKNNKTYVFDEKVPGDWWIKNFLERHKDKLTLRSVQNITKARAEKTLDEFKDYFRNLEISVQNLPPKNIMNYDETNVSDDPGSTKCIFRRGVKYPERILNHSKGCISIMFAGTADGDLLPPYVVYKSENLWTEWCKDGPEGARYNRNKSGWFDSVIFLDWFTNIVIPWAKQLEGPKLVIGDNLSSHLNSDVVEMCEVYQIRFVFLPPRSTQLTQPLDVAFFGPLKKSWRKILLQYKTENPKQVSLNKSHFPLLLKQLMDAANIKKQNLVSGFKTTGIYPFNPYEVYKKLPEYEDEIKYDVDQTLLDYLKENKYPNPIKRGKNTKITVPSGKSVSSADISTNKQKTTINRNKTVKKSIETITERIQDEKSEIKQRKIERLPNKTLSKKVDSKQKPLQKKKRRVESTSDSESSCVIPSSDTSEYDPRCDKDENIENEINGSVKSCENLKTKVTILSDIKNTADNQAYFDLSKYGPFALKAINTNYKVKTKAEKVGKIKRECIKIMKNYDIKPIRTPKSPSHKMTSNNESGASCSKEPEKNTSISYNINDYILVRYILEKRVQYFVGKIYAKVENRYQVSYLKQSGRNDNTKFIQPKKEDIDIINEEMIVKEVQLISINEQETEFTFLEDDDYVYFDY